MKRKFSKSILVALIAVAAVATCFVFVGCASSEKSAAENSQADEVDEKVIYVPSSLELTNTLSLDYLTLEYGTDWNIKTQNDVETIIEGPESMRLTVRCDYIGSDYLSSSSDSNSIATEASKYFYNHGGSRETRWDIDKAMLDATSNSQISTNGTAATITQEVNGSGSDSARYLMLLAFNGGEVYRVSIGIESSLYDNYQALFQEIVDSVAITRTVDTTKDTIATEMVKISSSGSVSTSSSSSTQKNDSSSASSSKSSSSNSSSTQNSDTGIQLPSSATDSRVSGTTSQVESYCKKKYSACKSASVSVQSWEIKDGKLYVYGNVEMYTRDGVGRYNGDFDAVYSGSSSTPEITLYVQGR